MKKFKFCPMCAAPLVERRKDRIECGDACGFVNYDNPTPVAAMVVEYEGKIVLAHNRAWKGDFHGLITGFVDHREAADQCAVREVKEELDLDAGPLAAEHEVVPLTHRPRGILGGGLPVVEGRVEFPIVPRTVIRLESVVVHQLDLEPVLHRVAGIGTESAEWIALVRDLARMLVSLEITCPRGHPGGSSGPGDLEALLANGQQVTTIVSPSPWMKPSSTRSGSPGSASMLRPRTIAPGST